MADASTEAARLEHARRYLDAIQRRAPLDELAAFFTEDGVQEEFPNRLVPGGAQRTLQDMMEGAERGRKVLTGERYEVVSELARGDRVVLEVLWTGTVAVPVGSTPAGGELHAHFAMFLDFRDGRIAAQRNYDCFDPF